MVSFIKDSAPWGVYSLLCIKVNQSQEPSLPSQEPIYTPGWSEAIIVENLVQGHKCHDQVMNPPEVKSDLLLTGITSHKDCMSLEKVS